MNTTYLDFYENEVKKLGNFDFVPENDDNNNYNVVVKTPNYFKYKDKFPEVIEKLRLIRILCGKPTTEGLQTFDKRHTSS